MTSFEQLSTNSNALRSGDVLLVESKNDWVDRIIKFFAKSKFTHTAMLVDIKGTWFVAEARPRFQQYTYQLMPVEWWFERNSNKDAYLGKMPTAITTNDESNSYHVEQKIKQAVLNPKRSLRPYNIVWLTIVYILQEWLGIKRPEVHKSQKPMICSTMVQETWEQAGVIEKGNYKSPGDIADLVGGIDSLMPLRFEANQANMRSDLSGLASTH